MFKNRKYLQKFQYQTKLTFIYFVSWKLFIYLDKTGILRTKTFLNFYFWESENEKIHLYLILLYKLNF